MEESGELPRDEVELLHFCGLGNELLGWEFSFLKTIVGLNVFNIGVGEITSVEFEVFHSLVFLHGLWWFDSTIVFSLDVWRISIKLCYLLNYGDEKARSVLYMWHHSQTLR